MLGAEVDFGRDAVSERLMRPLIIVKSQIARQARSGRARRGVGVQIDLLDSLYANDKKAAVICNSQDMIPQIAVV